MKKRKVIIDCDPGIDDTLALMLALQSKELDIVGITIVCGNVPVEKGAENALQVLSWFHRLDIPVYIGASTPLKRNYVDAMDTHGLDGLGESYFSPITSVRPKQDALQFLKQSFAQAINQEERLSVIALGPLTNIAQLLEEYPDFVKGLDQFVSMGGAYKSHGNCSPVAEYNYWCDPDAAKMVYENLYVHMVGLDVTRKIVLTPNLLEYMCNVSPEMGGIIKKITRFYFDFHWKQEGVIGCVINDPLAVAYFIDPSLCEGFDTYTQIETSGISLGQSVVDAYDFYQHEHNSYVLTKTDALAFMQFFFARVLGVKEDDSNSVLTQIMVL